MGIPEHKWVDKTWLTYHTHCTVGLVLTLSDW